jgi:hypothetical protein
VTRRRWEKQRLSTAETKGRIQFDGMAGFLARAALIGAIVFTVGIILAGRFW